MPEEPLTKRAHAFVDGQNLFYAAKMAFGYTFPNYDVIKLVQRVCMLQAWTIVGITFYTGVPDAIDNAFWNSFWNAKLAAMGTRGVTTISRPLRYHNKTIPLPDGTVTTCLVGQEKGIDVKMALDVVRKARQEEYDVALVFSQDLDLAEAASEVKSISMAQGRWIKMACAYPVSPSYVNRRGINGTDWINLDRELYDSCLDTADYRPEFQPEE